MGSSMGYPSKVVKALLNVDSSGSFLLLLPLRIIPHSLWYREKRF
jgi:hypothetical protein